MTESKSPVVSTLEAEMTRYQILLERAREAKDWPTYGEAKRAFARTWDELNRVKAQATEKAYL